VGEKGREKKGKEGGAGVYREILEGRIIFRGSEVGTGSSSTSTSLRLRLRLNLRHGRIIIIMISSLGWFNNYFNSPRWFWLPK
jgi:hypothetical protein